MGAHLDLSAFSSWEELASLGLDRLKSALMALGLKCGGTLEERAQRFLHTHKYIVIRMITLCANRKTKIFLKAKYKPSGPISNNTSF